MESPQYHGPKYNGCAAELNATWWLIGAAGTRSLCLDCTRKVGFQALSVDQELRRNLSCSVIVADEKQTDASETPLLLSSTLQPTSFSRRNGLPRLNRTILMASAYRWFLLVVDLYARARSNQECSLPSVQEVTSNALQRAAETGQVLLAWPTGWQCSPSTRSSLDIR